MDRHSLVEELNKAFREDDRIRNTEDTTDVEYREDTNTLLVNEQTTYNVLKEKEQEIPKMSEEELFGRLLKERRQWNLRRKRKVIRQHEMEKIHDRDHHGSRGLYEFYADGARH